MPAPSSQTTVLLVEDEALLRMFGADILQEEGFIVLEAGNADEAIAILAARDEIDLLFSDVEMPGSMDGVRLAGLVARRWPAIRILLTSGEHQLPSSGPAYRGKFLRKPWTQDALMEKIRDVLAI